MTHVTKAGQPLAALVVDDEAPARDELVWLLGADPRVGRVRSAAGGADALRALEGDSFDVVFCDIRMPGLDGLDLARVLARFAERPQVVFVTAYERHAVDAFDLAATDYLLKPVRPDRLAEAVRRVLATAAAQTEPDRGGRDGPAADGLTASDASGASEVRGAHGAAGLPATPTGVGPPEASGRRAAAASGAGWSGGWQAALRDGRPAAPADMPPKPAAAGPAMPGAVQPGLPPVSPAAQDETIAVELGGVIRFLHRSEVRYIIAQGDYVRLHTAAGSHLVRVPLGALAERWAAAGFVRIHRSALVALWAVDELWTEGGRCSVRIGNVLLPVSRRHTRALRDRLVRTTSLTRPGRTARDAMRGGAMRDGAVRDAERAG